MNSKFYFKIDHGQYKVPLSEELFIMNFEYFHGMGIYDESVCREKALLTTGFRLVCTTDDPM